MSKTILLNNDWHFTKENTGIPAAVMGEAITLPHTWNAVDGQDGGNDYYRGTCWYTLALAKPAIPAGGKAILQLDGAAMTAAVYLNGEKLAEHKGGYSTFRVDLTEHLKRKICWRSAWTTATTTPCTPRRRTLPSTAAFTAM